jgi:riboflavin synthase alpha subunit
MFTGLIREAGRLRSVRMSGGVTVLDIEAPRSADVLSIGDSLAVNGVCLTVTAKAGSRVRADVSVDTRRVTTIREWRAGDGVHLEPALRAGDRIGGHFVLGHVDGVGRVVRTARRAGIVGLTISADPAFLSRLLAKGSIAVDGVSLTLDEGPFARTFTVTLVPQTLRETRLGVLRAGDRVNLESDILSRAAGRGIGQSAPAAAGIEPITIDAIVAHGWTAVRPG